jgi:Rrf2 family protein
LAKIVSLSEAASIGIHSMVLIAKAADMLNVTQIAEATGSSRHHVAKVLQRLVKDNFLSSNRGPSGGFGLKKSPEEITLLQVYESIDGIITVTKCAMENPICPFDQCLMENIVGRLTAEIRDYMSKQTLATYL